MKFTAKCLYVDTPNLNGNVYPRSVIEKALKDFQDKIDQNRAVGTLEDPYSEVSTTTDLGRVSHKITNITMGETNCVIECEILDTPHGKIVKDLLSEDCNLSINPMIIGTLKDKVLCDDAKLVKFDISGVEERYNSKNKISIKE